MTFESAGVLLCYGEYVVLCKRNPNYKKKSDHDLPYIYEYPGGKIEEGETLEECAIREVTEETGLELHPRQITEARLYTSYKGGRRALFKGNLTHDQWESIPTLGNQLASKSDEESEHNGLLTIHINQLTKMLDEPGQLRVFNIQPIREMLRL